MVPRGAPPQEATAARSWFAAPETLGITADAAMESEPGPHSNSMESPVSQMYVPFEHQVAGHDRVVLLSDGALAKPTSATEVQFYLHLQRLRDVGSSPASAPAPSLPLPAHASPTPFTAFIPTFFGTCVLPDHPDLPAVVMENLVRNFRRPCLADFKLGFRLYGDDASEEKRRRMEEYSRTTTSGTLGVRLTGAKIWDPSTRSYSILSKHFGRSLTPSTFVAGVRRFFSDHTGTLVYGRYASLVADKLEEIRTAVESTPGLRLYSTSALVVFEGDLDGEDDDTGSHMMNAGRLPDDAEGEHSGRTQSISEFEDSLKFPVQLKGVPVENSKTVGTRSTVSGPDSVHPQPVPPRPSPHLVTQGATTNSSADYFAPIYSNIHVDPSTSTQPSPLTPTSTSSRPSTLADDSDCISVASAPVSEQAITDATGASEAPEDLSVPFNVSWGARSNGERPVTALRDQVDVRVIDFSHSTLRPERDEPDANFIVGLTNLVDAVREVANSFDGRVQNGKELAESLR
ncbi:SAICAR synthase-like protein [Gonapodya prolifera JEL478]|uniref:Kinase n=1 Tax=Gonapodya prolifera (strain JEL478) TaxID=1344416 RepID=A0A139AU29_GONPJ|nr:SAICAR synthase-like protein [Gonapodya prolifera JEL478]|eukprot:KXS20231.1 SAICAR synthase-like protein [Gonapodya prolifera JEL478]